jgi:hypothetical protein
MASAAVPMSPPSGPIEPNATGRSSWPSLFCIGVALGCWAPAAVPAIQVWCRPSGSRSSPPRHELQLQTSSQHLDAVGADEAMPPRQSGSSTPAGLPPGRRG